MFDLVFGVHYINYYPFIHFVVILIIADDTVAANDVALSTHTVLMTALLLFQIVIYEVSVSLPLSSYILSSYRCEIFISVILLEGGVSNLAFLDGFVQRGSQKVSKIAIAIVSAVCLFAAACFFVALPSHSWLWLISIFK
jgi:cystinosin